MTTEPHDREHITALQDQLVAKFELLMESDNERDRLALQLQMIGIREQLDVMTKRHFRFPNGPQRAQEAIDDN